MPLTTDSKFKKSGILKKTEYAIKIALAELIHIVIKPGKRNGNYWLFGLADDIYANNGRAFFEYMKKEHPEIELYWVCEKESIDSLSENIEEQHLIARRSVKNYLYALDAEVAVYGFSDRDVAPGLYRIIKRKTLLVNVSHGYDGLKGMPKDYYTPLPADIICAASSYEKRMKIEACGANPEKVVLTGFARYDNWPISKGKRIIKNIFIMPTWRDWYENEHIEWEQSRMHAAYGPLLRWLDDIAEKLDIKVKCNFHPRMRMLFRNSEWSQLEHIETCDESVSVKQALLEADLLITDYSSVFWDFLYMRKKTLLFWFDEEEYREKHGLLVDSKFYPYIYTDYHYLCETLKKEIDGEHVDEILSLDYFNWRDNLNSERIYQAIMNELGKEKWIKR